MFPHLFRAMTMLWHPLLLQRVSDAPKSKQTISVRMAWATKLSKKEKGVKNVVVMFFYGLFFNYENKHVSKIPKPSQMIQMTCNIFF